MAKADVVVMQASQQQWHRNYHPLLHEAAENTSVGAQYVLDCAYADTRLRYLFTDPTYVDKYGYTALQRIGYFQRTHLPLTHIRIAQALTPQKPQSPPQPWWLLSLIVLVLVVLVCSCM